MKQLSRGWACRCSFLIPVLAAIKSHVNPFRPLGTLPHHRITDSRLSQFYERSIPPSSIPFSLPPPFPFFCESRLCQSPPPWSTNITSLLSPPLFHLPSSPALSPSPPSYITIFPTLPLLGVRPPRSSPQRLSACIRGIRKSRYVEPEVSRSLVPSGGQLLVSPSSKTNPTGPVPSLELASRTSFLS